MEPAVEEVKQLSIPTCGRDLRALRINHFGLSARTMAERMGITKRTLLKAERDEGLWVSSMKAIADWLNKQPEFEDVEVEVTSIWPDVMDLEDEAEAAA